MLSSVHVTIAQEPGCDTAPQPSSRLPRLAADQQNLLFIQNEQWCEAKARTTPGWHLLAGALVADLDAQPPEALALALDLDDLDPADLAGGGHGGAAVRLLVQRHDVDDAVL